MSNQYTQGYSKPFLEGYHKIKLNMTSNEVIKKHYENRGYLRAHIQHDTIPGKKYEIRLYLTKIKAGYGDRYYIECEGCKKRVTYLLYTFIEREGKDKLAVACRHCTNVSYMSQQVTRNDVDYNYYIIRKIGKRLDPNFVVDDYLNYPTCPPRPKGMRHDTYTKLYIEFNKHVSEVVQKHAVMLGAIKKEWGI